MSVGQRTRELVIHVGAATDPGPVREQNEDALLVTDPASEEARTQGILLAIADGMGGYQRGEVAARLAIETLRSVYYSTPLAPNEIPQRLRTAFRQANERIYAEWQPEGEEQLMGTTLVAAVIRDQQLTVANVGDSRAYLIRAKRATQITRDHSLVAEQVAAGVLTEDEARESNYRNVITRALGHRQRLDVDIFELQLLADDRLVLTSDGVHDVVTPEELTQIVLAHPPEAAAKALIDLAIQKQTTDNVSAIVAWVKPAVEAAAEPAPARPGTNWLVVVLVLLGILVFIAVVGVILALGHALP
ncbi:PP2C family protein-serine/threonine phosphatase [Thermorudis peleae]|uniref:PP2C family protein-serine/threonine phosphatase n=1 Tax=Thermorudis peleae TaxID=1382356 RepID=UPI0006906434|nr:protein phosphatase 2C domain-containing protein [Thermorudis peleae]MBX6753317.1 serine/threonine-protein phosphatase [Thermorudis peleae]